MATQHTYIPLSQLHARAAARKIKCTKLSVPDVGPLPAAVSLRNQVPEIYDQGQLGSCTANAFCAAYRVLNCGSDFGPSRLWIYFYERLNEDPAHNVADLTDSGADVVDGASYVQSNGVCSESLWPYDVSQYNIQPPAACSDDASGHKISSYSTVSADDVKNFLANGSPVLVALAVYSSFEQAQDGQIPMPDTAAEQLMGGHELCIVGYDDDAEVFEVQNSWGSDWGDGGFCYIPYAYINDPNLCTELTVIQM